MPTSEESRARNLVDLIETLIVTKIAELGCLDDRGRRDRARQDIEIDKYLLIEAIRKELF